jgi:peptidoglycan biosynthesis protein MviN/MurJ (putative lipid II flippase)
MDVYLAFGVVLGCLFMLAVVLYSLRREARDPAMKPEWLYGEDGAAFTVETHFPQTTRRMDIPRKRPILRTRNSK